MRKTIFTKYSNDRADCFSIRTDILEDETGARVVQKIPMHPEAKRHLGNLSRWKESLDKVYSGCGYVMDRGRSLENGGVELEYIQGETLEEKLDGMLKAGQTEAVAKELEQFVETVCRPAKGQAFVMTEQFREVFGEVDLPKGQESLEVTDIDLICGNVVLGGVLISPYRSLTWPTGSSSITSIPRAHGLSWRNMTFFHGRGSVKSRSQPMRKWNVLSSSTSTAPMCPCMRCSGAMPPGSCPWRR